MGATGTTGNKLIYLTRCILVLLHTHKTPLFLVVYNENIILKML